MTSSANLKVILLIGVALFVGCGAPTSLDVNQTPKPSSDPVFELRQALSSGDWKRASLYSQQALIAQPNDPVLLSEVASVVAMNGHPREAAVLLVEATTMANFQPESRVEFALQALIDVGELYLAIDLLEEALQADPENVKFRRQLIGFLGESHRTQEIQPHLIELIRHRHINLQLLMTVTETSSRRFFEDNQAETLIQRKSDDRRVRLGEAYERFSEQNLDAAEVVLSDILAHHPDFAPAYALQGRVLIEKRQYDEFATWVRLAPAECKSYPEYWLALGDWANGQQKLAESCHAYWKATQCNPNLGVAWSRLSQALGSMAGSNSSHSDIVTKNLLQDIGQRINQLVDLHISFFNCYERGHESQSSVTKVAECLMNLGRNWEAEAWSAVATSLTEDPSKDLAPLREEILNRLKRDASWQSAKGQQALSLNLNDFPTADVSSQSSEQSRSKVVSKQPTSDHFRLVAMSKEWGLESVGGGNSPVEGELAPIYVNGAGGGSIDYDLDGWPDIVVMAAGGTMLQSDSKPNLLLRNIYTCFVNVTHEASVGDTGFGQGVASGDFNEDGFSDLFFANLGKNRLMRNNGDGTFTDCTDVMDDRSAEWTTSAAFVDVNSDGITDLFATNYCDIVPELVEGCPNDENQLGPCHPLKFPANGDQLMVVQENGRLTDVSDKLIPQVSIGRGLGIVAGALDGSNLSVYIANDMSANHYYRYHEGENRLGESAALRGLAVDGRAMTQASMGIAASDFDNDGDLDLYVTGFAQEYNIYYEQVAPGFWRDETSRLNLVEPTLMNVGFGTQAIDLDNDGVDEIAVTNGHIGEFEDPEAPPYKQPFQIFRRDQQGAFRLVDDDSWGQYLCDTHVGRALWSMDVNRDGLRDLLVTHTFEPIALLVNQTDSDAHRIAFRLVGTRSSRDAIGAVVRFECSGESRALWMLAGDGYLCCNEKSLHAGLGEADRINNVTVTWQSGDVDELGSLQADQEYLLVEGAETAFVYARNF